MKRLIPVGLAFLSLVILNGCAASFQNPSSPDRAMVYGHMEVNDGRGFVELVRDKWGDTGQSCALKDGTFFILNLEPGVYAVKSVERGDTVYNFVDSEKSFKESSFVVKPGAILYLGSFKIKDNDRNLVEIITKSGTYSIEALKTPSERESLLKIQEELKETEWAPRIAKKLGRLDK